MEKLLLYLDMEYCDLDTLVMLYRIERRKLEKDLQVCDGRIASPAPERESGKPQEPGAQVAAHPMSQQPSHQSSCRR